jgi:DNA repair exonuclease SbcCD ATPase subunit
MFSIVNRLSLLIVAGFVISSVGVGTAWSYLRTAHGALGQSLRDAVPIEFDLKRLQQMTDDLIPEIRTNQKVAAQLDVEIEYLGQEVQALRQSQTQAREQMRKLRQSLDTASASFTFGGKKFTKDEIEHDLAQRLERFDDGEKQLTVKERILAMRRQTLAAATGRIRQFQQQQELLSQKVESLKAELKLAELADASGSFQFDNSKLAQAKEAEAEVEKRIRVLEKLVEGDRQVSGEIPVEADSRPVSQKYDEYFKAAKQ